MSSDFSNYLGLIPTVCAKPKETFRFDGSNDGWNVENLGGPGKTHDMILDELPVHVSNPKEHLGLVVDEDKGTVARG